MGDDEGGNEEDGEDEGGKHGAMMLSAYLLGLVWSRQQGLESYHRLRYWCTPSIRGGGLSGRVVRREGLRP